MLKCQWDSALFSVQLGDRSRLAYWVNREYYPAPSNETCAAGDVVTIEDDELTTQAITALAAGSPIDEGEAINREIESLSSDLAQQDWLRAVSKKMMACAEVSEASLGSAEIRAKVLPVPPFLRRLVTQKITRAFLRDVNDFFFHPDRRERMEQSLIERIDSGGGPFVVVAHSQGSMIAYNVLRQLSKNECDVRLFLTLGSPLGLEEVQDLFKQWIGEEDLPIPPCVTRWVNIADWLDPVAADHDLRNDFAPQDRIENHDRLGLNRDSPLHPHSATGYLGTDPARRAVLETVGNAFAQPVGRAIIAKDLANILEDSYPRERHNVLIQLSSMNEQGPIPLAQVSQRVIQSIEEWVRGTGDSPDEAEIEPLKRFVAARLTRVEIEQLRTRFAELTIERVWHNAVKRALIYQSANTVQARPANVGYSASGIDIRWAVLDTGIRADHPHFQTFKNVERQWDCTKRGVPELDPASPEFAQLDKHGHGTHVAGILAGYYKVPFKEREPKTVFSGMAPQAKLYGFKVLDDQGNGQDSWIIKAPDRIGELNESAGSLVVHGINLSLGGNFDPSVYGCGHTPLCQELHRLCSQGVLICLAAGNEGYAMLQAAEGVVPSNMDLSIGDPANLDEAIAVGSIHKSNPHTYGVSYFSSRGPTADGRSKPDLVAPGEQILSAYCGYPKSQEGAWVAKDLYMEMSGTSMAAPHVSGILAAFLSMRREFIGYPARVKEILLNNCTDLGRDLYIQGRGLPNLVKMLANS